MSAFQWRSRWATASLVVSLRWSFIVDVVAPRRQRSGFALLRKATIWWAFVRGLLRRCELGRTACLAAASAIRKAAARTELLLGLIRYPLVGHSGPADVRKVGGLTGVGKKCGLRSPTTHVSTETEVIR